jgi:hypothetical protein
LTGSVFLLQFPAAKDGAAKSDKPRRLSPVCESADGLRVGKVTFWQDLNTRVAIGGQPVPSELGSIFRVISLAFDTSLSKIKSLTSGETKAASTFLELRYRPEPDQSATRRHARARLSLDPVLLCAIILSPRCSVAMTSWKRQKTRQNQQCARFVTAVARREASEAGIARYILLEVVSPCEAPSSFRRLGESGRRR